MCRYCNGSKAASYSLTECPAAKTAAANFFTFYHIRRIPSRDFHAVQKIFMRMLPFAENLYSLDALSAQQLFKILFADDADPQLLRFFELAARLFPGNHKRRLSADAALQLASLLLDQFGGLAAR